jgi:hypothetical protein
MNIIVLLALNSQGSPSTLSFVVSLLRFGFGLFVTSPLLFLASIAPSRGGREAVAKVRVLGHPWEIGV